MIASIDLVSGLHYQSEIVYCHCSWCSSTLNFHVHSQRNNVSSIQPQIGCVFGMSLLTFPLCWYCLSLTVVAFHVTYLIVKYRVWCRVGFVAIYSHWFVLIWLSSFRRVTDLKLSSHGYVVSRWLVGAGKDLHTACKGLKAHGAG